MRGLFSLVALVVVLAIVGINVRNELHTQKALISPAAAASGASSAPFGGTSSPSVAQFQKELDKAVQGDADATAARASDAEAR